MTTAQKTAKKNSRTNNARKEIQQVISTETTTSAQFATMEKTLRNKLPSFLQETFQDAMVTNGHAITGTPRVWLSGMFLASPAVAIACLSINKDNRSRNKLHYVDLATKMRTKDGTLETYIEGVASILISYEALLTNGQHTLVAVVLAFGTYRDYCKALFAMKKGDNQGNIPDTFTTDEDEIIHVETWLDECQKYYEDYTDAKLNDTDEPEQPTGLAYAWPTGWEFRPADEPESGVYLNFVVGVDPQSMQVADQDQLDRSAIDQLTMDAVSRDWIERSGMPLPLVKTTISWLFLRTRCSSDHAAKLREDKNAPCDGSLKGGRSIGPKAFPGYLLVYGDSMAAAQTAMMAATKEHQAIVTRLTDPNSPIKSRMINCHTIPKRLDTGAVQGCGIPTNHIYLALALAHAAGWTAPQLKTEALSLHYGVTPSKTIKGNIEVDKTFEPLRELIISTMKEAKSLPNPDMIIAAVVKGMTGTQDRFPKGIDRTGTTEPMHRVAKGLPAEKDANKGRPAGSKNK